MDKQRAAKLSVAAADNFIRAINEHGLISPQAIAAGHISRAAIAIDEAAGVTREDIRAARNT